MDPGGQPTMKSPCTAFQHQDHSYVKCKTTDVFQLTNKITKILFVKLFFPFFTSIKQLNFRKIKPGLQEVKQVYPAANLFKS